MTDKLDSQYDKLLGVCYFVEALDGTAVHNWYRNEAGIRCVGPQKSMTREKLITFSQMNESVKCIKYMLWKIFTSKWHSKIFVTNQENCNEIALFPSYFGIVLLLNPFFGENDARCVYPQGEMWKKTIRIKYKASWKAASIWCVDEIKLEHVPRIFKDWNSLFLFIFMTFTFEHFALFFLSRILETKCAFQSIQKILRSNQIQFFFFSLNVSISYMAEKFTILCIDCLLWRTEMEEKSQQTNK